MFKVVKRDGETDDFNLAKIRGAIEKAFKATGKEYTDDIIELLGLRVTADFQSKIKDGVVHVEDIQDSVETVLEQVGYTDVAKAYILYRKQREKMRNMKSTILNYKEIVDSYVKVEDWRVKENSTVTYSVGGLILSNSGAVTANYWLSEIYDEEIANAHRNCDIHIHDLSMLTGYCAGWSLKQLIREGLGGIEGKITSAPAKHLSVLCNQMVNFLGIMQNEWAGAQAFSSFDTYLAPFVKADNLSYPEVKKCRSGKSTYAEKLALSLSSTPVYLATARIWDEEFRKRVIHHQARRGPEWTNIEEEKELSRHALSGRTILIDCITLWCTNFFFDLKADTDQALTAAKEEFDRFTSQDATFIFVTNEIGMGGTSENEIQRKFTDMQGWMNQYIASQADEVILMVSGIPVKIKEDKRLKIRD